MIAQDPRGGALLAAEFALYEAKGAGRDRVVRAPPAMRTRRSRYSEDRAAH